jgi:hypothetical protein
MEAGAMPRTIKLGTIFVALVMTGACANDGRPRFISDRGVTKEVDEAQALAPEKDGWLLQFKLAAADARPFTSGPTPSLKKNDPAQQHIFLQAGFALINARCNEYILSKSDNQRQVNVWRDTFAPITALLTGAIALLGRGDETNNDALTALSLGTSAAAAGFRIYEQRFLFGAENVNSVRILILDALNDNATKAGELSKGELTYSQAVIHLLNNQAVCSPGHILQLVSKAIATGDVTSSTSDTEKTKKVPLDTASDNDRSNALLDQLKKDKVLTEAQISASKAKLTAAPPPITPPSTSTGFEMVTTTVKDKQ